MQNYQSCYDCIFCYSNINEFEVWCSETGKPIDDGFGEGDCTICIRFASKRNTSAFNDVEFFEPLPF